MTSLRTSLTTSPDPRARSQIVRQNKAGAIGRLRYSTATCRSRRSLASVPSRRKPTGSLMRRLPQHRYSHRARPEPVHCLTAPSYTTQVDVTGAWTFRASGDPLSRAEVDGPARAGPWRILIAGDRIPFCGSTRGFLAAKGKFLDKSNSWLPKRLSMPRGERRPCCPVLGRRSVCW